MYVCNVCMYVYIYIGVYRHPSIFSANHGSSLVSGKIPSVNSRPMLLDSVDQPGSWDPQRKTKTWGHNIGILLLYLVVNGG
jgi:hypothetical protein